MRGLKPRRTDVNMKLIIDRKENDKFVCEDEDGKSVVILCSDAEKNAKPGDVISLENGAYRVLKDETQKRREEILSLQNTLWE